MVLTHRIGDLEISIGNHNSEFKLTHRIGDLEKLININT